MTTAAEPEDVAARRARMIEMLAARGIRLPEENVEESGGQAEEGALLSPTEERMWMLHQLDPGAATGTMYGALWLHGALDEQLLLRAFRLVVAEQPSLRTLYREEPAEGVKPVVLDMEAWSGDMSITHAPSRAAALEEALRIAKRPFRIHQECGVRIRLIRVHEADELRLLVVVGHHISMDDAAWPILLRRVCEHVRTGARQPGVEDRRYRAYAAQRARRAGTDRYAAQLDYWRGVFGGVAPERLSLPTNWYRREGGTLPGGNPIDVAGGAVRRREDGEAGRLRLEVPSAGRVLVAAARRLGVSPFHMEVTALSALLAVATGRTQITIATPVVDIGSGEEEPPIGASGNLVPLDIRFDPGADVIGQLQTVKRRCLEAVANAEVPIEHVLGALGASGGSPFSVTVLLHQGLDGAVDLPNVRVEAVSLPPIGAEGDVTVAMERPGEALRLEVSYAPAIRTAAAAAVLDGVAEVLGLLCCEQNEREPILDLVSRAGPFGMSAPDGLRPRAPLAVASGSAGASEPAGVPSPSLTAEVLSTFQTVLPEANLDEGSDFFSSGGHSLLATRVIIELRNRLGVELRIADFFAAPTARGLAALVHERSRPEASEPEGDLLEEGDMHIPLTRAQRRLWFLERLGGLGHAYHVPIRLELSGEVDEAALEKALGDMICNHDVLRAVFSEDADGMPSMRILDDEELGELLPDMVTTADAEDVQTAQRRLEAWTRAPFRSDRPLLRAMLVRVDGVPRLLGIVAHHMVCDEWSANTLLRELDRNYGRATGSPTAARTAPSPGYAEYARSEAQREPDPAALQWWERELSGAPDDLLLFGRSRPVQGIGVEGAHSPVSVERGVAEGVYRLASLAGCSPFVVLETAFAATLERFGAGPDLLVATPVSGRGSSRFSETVGLFVNTVVLRHRFCDDATVLDAVRQTRDLLLAALEHAQTPFESVVERVARSERGATTAPLAQVFIQIHDDALLSGRLGGEGKAPVDYRIRPFEEDTAKFDLTLELSVRSDGIQGTLGYATRLYDDVDAMRLVEAYLKVLRNMVSDPAAVLVRIPVEEAGSVIFEEALAAPKTVPELMEQTEADASEPALDVDGAQLERAELDRRTLALRRRMAQRLGVFGGRRQPVVAVLAERGTAAVVAAIAVAASGAVLAPLPPGPPDVMRRRLEVLAPSLVLASDEGIGSLPDSWSEGALAVNEADAEETIEPLRVPVRPEDLATAIPTSGSSGSPKIVVGTQRALANRLAWDVRCGPAGGGAVLLLSSLGFIDGVTGVLAAACAARRLLVPDEAQLKDPAELEEIVRSAAPVAAATVVPSLLSVLLRERPSLVRAVSVWISSGETLPGPLVEEFRRTAPDSQLIDSYGQTEGAGDDARGLRSGPDAQADPQAVGGAVPGVRVRVLDHLLRPAPVGVWGEVYTSGAQLARGYLDAPALTASRFVAGENGTRMYRTGDRGRITTDGLLQLAGRSDRQLKVRGVRVDPASVEYGLCRLDGVVDAAVCGEQGPSGTRLVAAVCLADPEQDPGRVMAEAGRTMPPHEVPARLVVLPEIPRTISGKVDFQRLDIPAPEPRGHDEPRNDAERRIAEIFADVLGISGREPSRQDDFFALGGDSLTSLTVVARARRAGLSLTAAQILQYPLVAELARVARPVGPEREASGSEPFTASGLDQTQLTDLIAQIEGEE